MRLFWGCIHVTLRETELPLFLSQDIEVIPEEPFESVLGVSELRDYENSGSHPIINQWKSKCTIPEEVLVVLRRACLVGRQGVVSNKEAKLFNEWVDCIYIATDLNTAVNISKWFDGEVLYRLFGNYDEIGDISNKVKDFSEEELKRIHILPIFNSLLDLEACSLFKDTSVIHGTRSEIPAMKWKGFLESEDYCVVGHNIRENSRVFNIVDSLSDFARRNIVWLLGKNNLDQVPDIIKKSYLVTGYQERQDYYKSLSSKRLVLHPFNSPYHNHYTNLECVASGIPVLLLSQNPLANESHIKESDWPEFGIYPCLDDMKKAAVELYNDEEKLNLIRRNQKELLRPFSNYNILQEISALLSKISIKEKPFSIATNYSAVPSFIKHSFDKRLSLRDDFVRRGGELELDIVPHSQLRVDHETGEVELVLEGGRAPIFFSPGLSDVSYARGAHKFSFHLRGEGQFGLSVEIWRQAECKRRFHLSSKISKDIRNIKFCINLKEDAELVFFLASTRAHENDSIAIVSLVHDIEKRIFDEDSLYPLENVEHWGGSGVKTNFTSLSPLMPSPEYSTAQGLAVKPDQILQLILPKVSISMGGMQELCLSFIGSVASEISVVVEVWVDNAITSVHRHLVKHERVEADCVIRLPNLPKFFVPVIYLESVESVSFLDNIDFKGCIINHDDCVETSQSQSEIKHYYGQFNPPVDKVLYETFFYNWEGEGFYLECGACDGVSDSSCLFFQKYLGWSGVNIEPTPYFFRKLVHNRPSDLNLNIALSDVEGRLNFRQAVHPFWGHHFGNGSLHHLHDHIEELEKTGCDFENFTVVTKTFQTIIAENSISRVDLMVLDVEGYELSVLSDINKWEVLPLVLCVEFPLVGLDALREIIEPAGYTYVGNSFSNAFWRRNDFARHVNELKI